MSMNFFKSKNGKWVSMLAAAAVAVVVNVSGVQAQTLERIKERGRLIVGVQGANPPFGFLNTRGENDGYDADIARLLGEKLGVPVSFVSMASADRIPSLNTGKVDVLFATLAMTAERAQSVQYSQPYAGDRVTVLAPKTLEIKSTDDLKGLTLGAQKSSSQERELLQLVPESSLLRFDDDSATIQALLSNQVEAIGANQFFIDRFEELRPGLYEDKLILAQSWNGAGTILGDKEMNATVNAFLDELKENGKLAELYQKWMKLPLPEFPASMEGIPYTVQ
ncbi:transporter substrate-binding domain-containing protein [Pseudochelatococcus sp. B33]